MNKCKKGGFLATLFNAILEYILPKPTFFIIEETEYGGDEVFGYQLIKKFEDLPEGIPGFNIDPKIFKECHMVLLSLGSKPTGGYGITVTDTQRCGCTLVLQYKTTKPGKGPVTMAFTNPYCLIAIPKYNKITLSAEN